MSSKQKKQPTLHIRGVVTAQKHAQQVVHKGIPESFLPEFQNQLKAVVHSVEDICRQYKTSPGDLPVRTQRAYAYLKGLLEKGLPHPEKKRSGPPSISIVEGDSSFRLRGILALCQYLQENFNQVTSINANEPGPMLSPWEDLNSIQILPVFQEIQTATNKLIRIMQQANLQASDLPTPSLRAYQWLSFLNQPVNLQAHLQALREVEILKARLKSKTARGEGHTLASLKMEFYNIQGLYRSQQQGPVIRMVANEGFIHAPQTVMQSLLLLATNTQTRQSVASIRAYADSKPFVQLSSQLAHIGHQAGKATAGKFQDLQKVFSRVNAAYFDNQLEQPKISWSNRLTYRKFGHYVPSTDSVMISSSLDDPKIPDYLLDFVMYHELLHKHLGHYTSNGRRMSHHKLFRQMEKQFAQYDQAQKALDEISKNVARGKKRRKRVTNKLAKKKTRR